jgi:hypothetical protein
MYVMRHSRPIYTCSNTGANMTLARSHLTYRWQVVIHYDVHVVYDGRLARSECS